MSGGIDSSIYSNIRQFKMDDPAEVAGKEIALRTAKRQFQMDEDMTNIARETGGDPEKMSAALLARGHVAPALQLRSQVAKTKQEEALALQHEQTRFTAMLPSLRDDLARVGDDASLAAHREKIAALAGTFTTPQFKQMVGQMAAGVPQTFDPKWLASQLQTADSVLKKLNPEYGAPTNAINPETGKPDLYQAPRGPGEGRFLGVAPAAAPAAPTELARLTAERDALPAGDPRRAHYDRVLSNYKAGRGGVEINSPLVAGPMTPSKPTANKIQEDLIGATRNLMQLDTIQSQFKPEFQRFGDKVGFAALKLKDSTTGLTVKEKKDLGDYSTYRRNAFNTLNDYIKSVTGAAMSEAEAVRIRKSMPDPGDGIFDGDSPTEFEAKMKSAITQSKMAVARLSYMNRRGMSLGDGKGDFPIPLDSMPKLMNDRGREIEEQMKGTISGPALKAAVRRQLAIEFGLSSD